LGASRRRLFSQLLTEAVLLSVMGGGVGLLVGDSGLRLLAHLGAGDLPRIADTATLDWRMLAFALSLSIPVGLAFGALPALRAATSGWPLGDASARTGVDPSTRRARSLFVVAEMALAVVLLAGAGLLIRTLWALRTVDPGFDARNVLILEMSLAGSPFRTAPAVAQLIRDAERRVGNLPGVIAVAATYSLPLESQLGGPLTIEGLPDDVYGANYCVTSWRYFDVFRIPVTRGRALTGRDDERAPAVALINRAMADGRSGEMKAWATFPWRRDPLQHRLTMGKTLAPALQDRTRQIVGVVGQVSDLGLGKRATPTVYVPLAQLTDSVADLFSRDRPLIWAIRTGAEPHAFRAGVERELRAASGGLPVAHVRSMEQVVAASTSRTRFEMVLLSVFAALAVVLAAIGVYGLTAYAVGHRTHEIGVRLALGASPRRVRLMVVWEGMRLAVIGVVLGVGGALVLTPSMAGLLYGVEPSNPILLTAVAALLTGVALLAVHIPARRITRVDPVLALRTE
jgi:predicted permease